MGRVLFGIVLIVGLAASVAIWTAFPPGWQRLVVPSVTISLLGFLVLIFRKDRAPDYLRWAAPYPYLDRDGFCFSIRTSRRGKQAFLDVYFQNRFERPCEAEVAVRPARWTAGMPLLAPISMRIDCGPAACGIASVSFPVPTELQGKQVSVSVGAEVGYPHGKGRRMRFGWGLTVEQNANFEGTFGMPHHGWQVSLPLPDDVETVAKEAPRVEVRTVWIFGDAPLERWPTDT